MFDWGFHFIFSCFFFLFSVLQSVKKQKRKRKRTRKGSLLCQLLAGVTLIVPNAIITGCWAAPACSNGDTQRLQQWDRIQHLSVLCSMVKFVSSSKQTFCPTCLPDFYLSINISQLFNAFWQGDIWYRCLLTLGTVALTLLLWSDIYMDSSIVLILIVAAKW